MARLSQVSSLEPINTAMAVSLARLQSHAQSLGGAAKLNQSCGMYFSHSKKNVVARSEWGEVITNGQNTRCPLQSTLNSS